MTCRRLSEHGDSCLGCLLVLDVRKRPIKMFLDSSQSKQCNAFDKYCWYGTVHREDEMIMHTITQEMSNL